MKVDDRGRDAGRAWWWAVLRTERDRRLAAQRGQPITAPNLRRLLSRRVKMFGDCSVNAVNTSHQIRTVGTGRGMGMSDANFCKYFEALTGNPPYPWQQRLFDQFINGELCDALDIPTGLGKTSVILIWLLAHLLSDSGRQPPMRLVYVVNRRTIVDQATDEAMKLAHSVSEKGTLQDIWQKRFAGGSMAVSTLRGALADNGDWLLAPHRPAIVIGTVDMIGSRLLFNGYRAGRWQRSRHAGLIGWDTLLVHDEAHLSKPFQTLLDWVSRLQPQKAEKRLRVMPMSATSAGSGPNVLRISAADREQPLPARVLSAVKRVRLHGADADLDGQLARLATAHGTTPSRIIVFVRTPDLAKKIKRKLHAKPFSVPAERIALLTGTIRGFERDALIQSPVLKHLLKGWGDDLPHTEYLISTSAGEVGADFDADHMICDLSTIDAMIQRFGRVNRRGGVGRAALIDVVLDRPRMPKPKKDGTPGKPDEFDRRRINTAKFLENLSRGATDGFDASPVAVTGDADSNRAGWREQAGYEDACSPPVMTIEPHPATLDAWSLTSVRERWPVATPVEPYLRGVDKDAPRTTVAWRAELDELPTKGILNDDAIEQIFEDHRLLPRELLQDRPEVVADLLLAVKKRRAESPVVLIRGTSLEVVRSTILPDDPKRLAAMLGDVTIVLPTRAGGLSKGMIDPEVADRVDDVADENPPIDRRRFIVFNKVVGDEPQWQSSPLPKGFASQPDIAEDADIDIEGASRWTAARDKISAPEMRMFSRVTLAEGDEGPTTILLLYRKLPDKKHQSEPPTVAAHNAAVESAAHRRVIALLPANCSEAKAIVAASASHDLGKAWDAGTWWQMAAGNPDATISVAKSFGRLNNKYLEGYRHEFGSLTKVVGLPLESAIRELALHLIATHHGRGRPHFEPGAMKVDLASLHADLTPAAVARRFDRLQRQYGYWGLAWLESILMSADVEVSRTEEQPRGGQS